MNKFVLIILLFLVVSTAKAHSSVLLVGEIIENNFDGEPKLSQNFPNPAKVKTEIQTDFDSDYAVLKIYNVLGKLIETIQISKLNKTVIIDLSQYQNGIYLYTFEADGQKMTKRFTVKH